MYVSVYAFCILKWYTNSQINHYFRVYRCWLIVDERMITIKMSVHQLPLCISCHGMVCIPKSTARSYQPIHNKTKLHETYQHWYHHLKQAEVWNKVHNHPQNINDLATATNSCALQPAIYSITTCIIILDYYTTMAATTTLYATREVG